MREQLYIQLQGLLILEKKCVFSFVLNDAKDCECRTKEWELVPGVSSLISKRALIIRLCSDLRNTEKSIIR